jgi:hypothetical protein
LATAEQNANSWVNAQESECAQLGEDVCQAVQQYDQCFSAALTLAKNQADFPFSSPEDMVGSLGQFLENSAKAVVSTIGEVLDYGSQIISAVGTIFDLITAYNTCSGT